MTRTRCLRAALLVILAAGAIQEIVSAVAPPEQPGSRKEEDLTFDSGGWRMAATLFSPAGGGRHPAIVVTHGAGREGRRSPEYVALARELSGMGLAILLFDKRGVGESEGQYVETPDLHVPAGDVIAAVHFLRQRDDIDGRRIGVMGHSQGGWIAPLAASLSRDLAFVISLCGAGVSIADQDDFALANELRSQGFSEPVVGSIIGFQTKLYAYLGTRVGQEALKPEYERAVGAPWFRYFREQGFTDELPKPEQLSAPVFDFFRHIRYDPAEALRSVRVPTLAVFGEEDRVVPTTASVQRWREAFAASGNDALVVAVVPHEGHQIFGSSESGSPLRPGFRQPLIDWLGRHVQP